MISQNQSVILDPVDYLNESISGISFPGISDLNISQQQTSTNQGKGHPGQGLGKLHREPTHENNYFSPDNILTKIENTFTVTFRRNSGLYNYFMLYETILWKYDKRTIKSGGRDDLFQVYILDDTGCITAKVELSQPLPQSIDGVEFGYDKVERQSDTFTVTFTFNNIDYTFLPGEKDLNPN